MWRPADGFRARIRRIADLDLEPRDSVATVVDVFFRQFLNDNTSCASYMLGCNSAGELAVVDAHVELVDEYVAVAESQGSRIAAVAETHVQADHYSGLPELVDRTCRAVRAGWRLPSSPTIAPWWTVSW